MVFWKVCKKAKSKYWNLYAPFYYDWWRNRVCDWIVEKKGLWLVLMEGKFLELRVEYAVVDGFETSW